MIESKDPSDSAAFFIVGMRSFDRLVLFDSLIFHFYNPYIDSDGIITACSQHGTQSE